MSSIRHWNTNFEIFFYTTVWQCKNLFVRTVFDYHDWTPPRSKQTINAVTSTARPLFEFGLRCGIGRIRFTVGSACRNKRTNPATATVTKHPLQKGRTDSSSLNIPDKRTRSESHLTRPLRKARTQRFGWQSPGAHPATFFC